MQPRAQCQIGLRIGVRQCLFQRDRVGAEQLVQRLVEVCMPSSVLLPMASRISSICPFWISSARRGERSISSTASTRRCLWPSIRRCETTASRFSERSMNTC